MLAFTLTGVTKGVVSGVASIAGSGGESTTVSLDGVKFFLTIEVPMLTFPGGVIFPEGVMA